MRLGTLITHIYFFPHNAAVEYCAVPTFLRALPVSGPCLSSSFKSIYCWRKSIRLSEGKVEHPRAHACVCVCVFPIFLPEAVRKKRHTSEGMEPFPWTARSMDAGFNLANQTHTESIFHGRSSHISLLVAALFPLTAAPPLLVSRQILPFIFCLSITKLSDLTVPHWTPPYTFFRSPPRTPSSRPRASLASLNVAFSVV